MTGQLKKDAQAVLGKIEANIAHYDALPDERGKRIHCLFVRLYRETTIQWLAALDRCGNPDFAYRALRHFYDLYQEGVVNRWEAPIASIPRAWRTYHRLARRLTMRSPITSHLLVISLGARAHIRHDLGIAILRAAHEHHENEGVWPDIQRGDLFGGISEQVFLQAALDYVDWHRQRQRGWRYSVLTTYATGLRALRSIWLPVMEGWRAVSLRDALAHDRLGTTHQPPSAQGSAGNAA